MGDTKMDEVRHGLTESEYVKLPPENRAALEWLREYMATPLTDEEKVYWRELAQFVEDEQGSEVPAGSVDLVPVPLLHQFMVPARSGRMARGRVDRQAMPT